MRLKFEITRLQVVYWDFWNSLLRDKKRSCNEVKFYLFSYSFEKSGEGGHKTKDIKKHEKIGTGML